MRSNDCFKSTKAYLSCLDSMHLKYKLLYFQHLPLFGYFSYGLLFGELESMMQFLNGILILLFGILFGIFNMTLHLITEWWSIIPSIIFFGGIGVILGMSGLFLIPALYFDLLVGELVAFPAWVGFIMFIIESSIKALIQGYIFLQIFEILPDNQKNSSPALYHL